MYDNFRYKGLRAKLIEKLKAKGINNEKVLGAMNMVQRHLFFDKAFHDKFAYDDIAFPIGQGQTISQPYIVALMTEALSFRPHYLRLKKELKYWRLEQDVAIKQLCCVNWKQEFLPLKDNMLFFEKQIER